MLGVSHQCFFVFTLIGRFLAVGTFHAAMLGPCQSEPYPPAWMQRTEPALAERVVEYASNGVEFGIVVAESIAMSHVEYLAVDFHGRGLVVNNYPTFFFKVAIHPDVVVAREEMHLHAHVGEFRQFAEKPGIAFRHYILVFIPEVEHVAQQIDGGSLVLDVVEKAHQASLLHPAMWDGQRAKMRIRKYINVFLHRLIQIPVLFLPPRSTCSGPMRVRTPGSRWRYSHLADYPPSASRLPG